MDVSIDTVVICFMGKGESLQNLEKSWEQMQESDPQKQK